MLQDGKWFVDTGRVLLKDPNTKYDYEKRIFHPPPGWKHLFFQSDGYRVLKDGDRVLFCKLHILLALHILRNMQIYHR